MKRSILQGVILIIMTVFLMIFSTGRNTVTQSHHPEGRPEEWVNLVNRSAPGDDWRQIEAASLRELIEARRMKSGSDELDAAWSERGPVDVPGRITDIDIDYAGSDIYCVSDHGIVFRGNLDGTGWQPLNDQHPVSQDVGCFLQVIRLADGIRLLSGGWQKTTGGWGVQYSDDMGKTWSVPAGLFQYSISGIRRCKVTRDGVYIFVQEYHAQKSTDYYTIYKSTDQGTSFNPLYRSRVRTGDGYRFTRSDMWMREDGESGPIWLALEDSLFIVNSTDGSRVYKNQISGIRTENGLLLTGSSIGDPVRLRAWIGDAGTARYYASDNGGESWVHNGDYTDGLATYPFGYNSFACSTLTADTLYFGGILIIRSTDAGATWTFPDMDPTNSYALYHGDVPKILMISNPAGITETYIGTDGGMYRQDATHDHFVTMSVPGLNSTQIYKMSSKHNEPGKMFAGTQDNGYIRTLTGSDPLLPAGFNMIWGGDVTNLASGDDGRTFWVWWWGEGCNYVTVPETDFTISNFSPSWVNKECPYWEAPIWVPVQNPDQCFTAGRPKGSSGSYLLRIQAQRNAAATATQYPYNFKSAAGDLVTAIAVSPVDSSYWYAATANGYFFRSTDAGKTWSTKKLLSSSLYARAIYPSKKSAGKLWVGGSGYSNSAVYYSDDNGATFKALQNGLQKTIVEAFDANADESLLFAATGVAPMMLRTATGEWTDIAGTRAPLVHYMDVEIIPGINTVRFATYARGIWDFVIPESVGIQPDIVQTDWIRIWPVPAHDIVNIGFIRPESGPTEIRLYAPDGKMILSERNGSGQTTLNTSGLHAGIYTIGILRNGKIIARKIVVE